MAALLPIVALLIIAAVAWLAIRAGAMALAMTGLSTDIARFQALSAFFGVGFTTSEAEMVLRHPVRRRIIAHLMIVGNVGLTSAVAALVVTFVQNSDAAGRVAYLVEILVGLLALILLTRLGIFQRALDALIRRSLRSAGVVRAMDYDLLLRAHHGYVISEIAVEPGAPVAGRSLRDAALSQRGVLVLGITRASGEYVGSPKAAVVVHAGDALIVYGKEADLKREILAPVPHASPAHTPDPQPTPEPGGTVGK